MLSAVLYVIGFFWFFLTLFLPPLPLFGVFLIFCGLIAEKD